MVAISAIRKANDTLGSRPPGLVSVFVFLLARSKARCASQLAQLGNLNPNASIVFVETEVSLLENVDAARKDISARESSLDLLYMSPGVLAFGGPDCKNPSGSDRLGAWWTETQRIDKSEALDKGFSLSYYARMRFIHNLLPLLNKAPTPRVLSVLAGGQERKLITDDLGLKNNYSILNVVDQTTTMHSLALEHIAKANPSISFVHVYPS